ncbi:fibroleukin [Heteronotia binoei]|uniref:fibroleukin n=1 Tax=Heteronotia binoei TaxID=13085 RepID=UPI0029310C9D|nr:fibroleukin [Heteronotia binoei]
MKVVFLILLQAAGLLFANGSGLMDDGIKSVQEEKESEACPITVKTGGKCGGREQCPYQVTLPQMTIQLPWQFQQIEKTIKEVESLKEVVNNLKKTCPDCKLQADDNQEADSEFLPLETDTILDYSKSQEKRVKELQSKVSRLSAGLKDAKTKIHLLQGQLEQMNLINMDNVENYVDGKIANLTFVVNSLDHKCSSNCPAEQSNAAIQLLSRDCSDYFALGKRHNGIYTIAPDPRNDSFEVYCDMESMGGGWTVIQIRQDGSTNFNRTWSEYKNGFGNLSREFWLGNDKIHLLTKSKEMQLRIELEDFNGVRKYSKYEQFYVANEFLKYRLSIGGYTGTAGDALHFSKHYNHDQKFFTTPDRDNDRYSSGNCGAYYSSGWWFDACMAANLNGKYYHQKYRGVRDGIFWGTWPGLSDDIPSGYRQPFKKVKIMIRPKVFMS